MLHSDVRSFVKQIMLVSIYPSFYAINRINQKKKKMTMKSCICLFTTGMNSLL